MEGAQNEIDYPDLDDIYKNATAPMAEGDDPNGDADAMAMYEAAFLPEDKDKEAYPVVILYGTNPRAVADIGNVLANDQHSPFSGEEPEELEMTMVRLTNPMNPTAVIIKIPSSTDKGDPKFQRIKLLESVLSQYPEASKTILFPVGIDEKPLKKHTLKSLKLISDLIQKDPNGLTQSMVIMTKCQQYCNYRNSLGDSDIKVIQKLRKKHENLTKKIRAEKKLKNLSPFILRHPHIDNPDQGLGMVSSWMVNNVMTPAELECYSIQKNDEIKQRDKAEVAALYQAQHGRVEHHDRAEVRDPADYLSDNEENFVGVEGAEGGGSSSLNCRAGNSSLGTA